MPKAADLESQRFGMLSVERRIGTTNGKARWSCVCDCGRGTSATTGNLRSGLVASCGCTKGGKTTHGHNIRGKRTPEYTAWSSMHNRCSNPKCERWPHYGGRGIRVCEPWSSFESFLADMGTKPTTKHSIDRIDVNGKYEPSNCRWATQQQQANNKQCHTRKLS